MTFTLQRSDPHSRARAGLLTTEHGTIETPIFMPVGTAGTVKAVQQLNGVQQVRMRQAIAKTYHSLDLVDDLVEQWQGGRFPALNKARILAAKQGLPGPQAQKIATLLDQQINDVVGEMANVLMGGNSPTDRPRACLAQ